MGDMLKIGDFSRLTQVPVKTIRYYDEIGLLPPEMVDRFTGYRYYTARQMGRLNRILFLKALGLSLEEIGRLLDEDLPPGELRRMLDDRQKALEAEIAQSRARLTLVEARLGQIEQEGRLDPHGVVFKEMPALRVLAFRSRVPDQPAIKPFFLRVADGLRRAGVQAVGPWLSLYHQGEFRQYDLDLEAAIPVSSAVSGPVSLGEGDEMTIRQLPAQRMACVICRMETMMDITAAYQALLRGIEENRVRILTAPCREAYFDPPEPGKPVYFEIQLPVTAP
jgi:DNA-binding transcriptional MerR regulator